MIILTQADQSRVAIQYQRLSDTTRTLYKTITIDRRCLYSPTRLWARSNKFATWTSVDLQTDSSKGVLEKRSLPSSSATLHPHVKRRPVPYSVRVKAATQGPINGALPSKANFLSIIVNKTEGFVIVPQAVVPSSIGSITIVFEGSIELPATKVFESTSGWAIAKYDPALIEGQVEPATFSDIPFEIGDKTRIYGLNGHGDHPCMVEATVTQIAPLPNVYDTSIFHHPIHLEFYTSKIHVQAPLVCCWTILAMWWDYGCLFPYSTMANLHTSVFQSQ